jgi:hypothetical protein
VCHLPAWNQTRKKLASGETKEVSMYCVLVAVKTLLTDVIKNASTKMFSDICIVVRLPLESEPFHCHEENSSSAQKSMLSIYEYESSTRVQHAVIFIFLGFESMS